MKYSFIMPCLNRSAQLHNTLVSFLHHYGDRDDYEVIIVVDFKNTPDERMALVGVIRNFENEGMEIQAIESPFKDPYSPVRVLNYGVAHARGQYVIITNPECFHKDNVLKAFDKQVAGNRYVLCACHSVLDCSKGIKSYEDFKYKTDIWYQHTEHNPRNYHWCSCIDRDRYCQMGGFDEIYGLGIAYDDDDFLMTVKKENITIQPLDNAVVLHQDHPRPFEDGSMEKAEELTELNRKYFAEKWGV